MKRHRVLFDLRGENNSLKPTLSNVNPNVEFAMLWDYTLKCIPINKFVIVVSESLSPVSGTSCDESEDHFGSRRKQKRGILPKYATSIMRSWLFQHLVVCIILLFITI